MEITIKWNVDSKSDWDPEELRNEIQDLKLENDRLMQQNKLMIDYIHALACIESKKSKFHELCGNCNCPYYEYGKGCKLGLREFIEKEAANIIDKLEAL